MESSTEIFRYFTKDRLPLERGYLEKHILNTKKLIDNFTGQRRYLFFSEDSVESLNEQLNCWRLLIALYDAENESPSVRKLGEADSEYRKFVHLCRWLEDVHTDSEFETLFAVSSMDFKKSIAGFRSNPDIISRLVYKGEISREEARERSDAVSTLLIPVWQFLRKGKLLDAANHCGRIGQYWRSATLLGGAMYHSEKLPAEYRSQQSGITGGRMWLKTCLNLSRKAETLVEKAIYGWLCGNMDAILPMCQTTEDRLWAYMHCWAVSLKISSIGQEQSNLYSDCSKLPTIYEFLFSAPKRTKGTTELSHYQDIKRHLIMGDHAEVLRLVHNIVSALPSTTSTLSNERKETGQIMCIDQQVNESSVQVSSSFIQFALHLLAYIIPYHLRSDSSPSYEKSGEDVTNRWLRDIVNAFATASPEATSTVVYYTLCDREERIRRISKTAGIITLEKRSEFMKSVQELYPHEYEDITMAVVQKILDIEVDPTSPITTEEDMEKILSLDLLVVSGFYSGYLNKVNALLCSFLEAKKLDAGYQLYDKTKLNIIHSLPLAQEFDEQNTIKEFHNWGDFITALRWYETWSRYRKQRPFTVSIDQPQTESNWDEDDATKHWREQDLEYANQLCSAFEKVLLNENWMEFHCEEGIVVADTKNYFKFKKMLLWRYMEVAKCYTGSLEFNSQAVLKSVISDDTGKPMDMETAVESSNPDKGDDSLSSKDTIDPLRGEDQEDIEQKTFLIEDCSEDEETPI